MGNSLEYNDIINGIKEELNAEVKEIEHTIRKYGAFNIIAKTFVHCHILFPNDESNRYLPTISEYVSLICLKYSYTEGLAEFQNPANIGYDMFRILELSQSIVSKRQFLQHSEFNTSLEGNEMQEIARTISTEEMAVRNPTFEHHHWDMLEDLYEPYSDYLNDKLGFNIIDAIDICISIKEFITNKYKESLQKLNKACDTYVKEILAYKYHNKKTTLYYPEEMLLQFKAMSIDDVKNYFKEVTYSYHLVNLGSDISFTPKSLAEFSNIDINIITKFLDLISITFESIDLDFSSPEILHPLKEKPIITHNGRYICSSLSLLDYSLDSLFEGTLLRDSKSKKNEKFKLHKHELLVQKGITYIAEMLNSDKYYSNLKYYYNDIQGEVDGLVLFDNNIFIIEAKSHRITDRAKKGYLDRIDSHLKEIVIDSHTQAVKAHKYIQSNSTVSFKNKKDEIQLIEGKKYTNAYFVSLCFEPISFISCNLKIGNTLGIFSEKTFPWIVSLYDLRVISEYIESPSFFLHFLERRKDFFKHHKIKITDELDILSYYLTNNLRFNSILSKTDYMLLDSTINEYNNYYYYEQGITTKHVEKKKHKTLAPIKDIIKAIDKTGLLFRSEASKLILEFSKESEKRFMEYLKKTKKIYKKDKSRHDFSIGLQEDGVTWHFTYFLAPKGIESSNFFNLFVGHRFNKHKPDHIIAIFDSGIDKITIEDIIFLTSGKRN